MNFRLKYLRRWWAVAGLLLLWWGPAAPVFAQDKRSDLAIVVNDSSLLESVSSAELQKIFKRDKLRGPGASSL